MKKKYYLWIIGCQMNYADAEKIATVLNKLNYQQTNNEKVADLIITVACSVRQTAIERIYGKAADWQKIKEKKPLITILTGCVLKSDRLKMSKFFDFIFDIRNLHDLSRFLVRDRFSRSLPKFDYFNIHPSYQNNFQAYVPISTGCNNFCSYCVVPYVRGREISRKTLDIINECKNLIKKGYKEITLLGQNVNSYGSDLKNKVKFPALLKTIADLPGDFWLRFVTSHPKDLNNELIEVMAKNKKICRYLHLPIQSGDNAILKKMNRKYTREHYLNLIKKVREKIPGIAITTDVIIGFPGETKKQFDNTIKLFREAKFDMAYIAKYSPRPGTTAFKLKGNINQKEKEKRYNQLNKILNQTALEKNKKLIGKILKVLVEYKRKNFNYGKTEAFKTVKFITTKDCTGQFVDVKIIKAQAFGLEAILVK